VSSLSLFDAHDREGRIQNGEPFFFYARACMMCIVKMRTRVALTKEKRRKKKRKKNKWVSYLFLGAGEKANQITCETHILYHE